MSIMQSFSLCQLLAFGPSLASVGTTFMNKVWTDYFAFLRVKYYKELSWAWGADRKIRPALPSDAKQ